MKIKLAIVAICALLINACASAPTTSGYLSDYERLAPGQYLEKYWADANNIQKADSPLILMGEIATDMISDKKDVTVADSVSWLKSALQDGDLITTDSNNSSFRLDVAITVMDPGSAAKRIWAGELGAGHAQVQVEGKLYDIEGGSVRATFAERRTSSGAIGLKDVGGDAGPSLIEEMIQQISEDVKAELRSTLASG